MPFCLHYNIISNTFLIINLLNQQVSVPHSVHSGDKFWKLEEIKFVGICTHICRFEIKLNVEDEINISK